MARVLALLFCRPRGKLAYLVRVAHSRLPTALGLGVSTQGAVGGGDGPGPRLCRLDPVFGEQKVCPRASGSLCMKQRSFACPMVPGTPPELLLQHHFIQDQDQD